MNSMKKFKIGGVPEHFNFPWRVAIEEKAFESIGVSLHWSDMTGGTGQMIKGLETGSLDIAVLLTEGISKAILQGTQAKIIDLYVVSPLQWGIHVPIHHEGLRERSTQRFAISRFGSGSHLMSFVLAQKNQWKKEDLAFNVIGDVYGGIWALENNEADVFLWEKYTTQPFVDKGSCRRVGQVDTPWPCFVIACRNDVLTKNRAIIEEIIALVKKQAAKLSSHPKTAEDIAWRYHLSITEVQQWLSETTWNTETVDLVTAIEPTVNFLHEAELISAKEAEAWATKLF
jgi:ABC-type nitrate/sulfonate/bicarbonate transport system substrate-binding protein